MSTASEQAGAFLAGNGTDAERAGERRGASGDYARLRDLIEKDELTDDETGEFESLAEKRRSGTLAGSPTRTVYKRKSIAGEREDESDRGRPKPKSASEAAAAILRGYGS